jgi:hypothetical protein
MAPRFVFLTTANRQWSFIGAPGGSTSADRLIRRKMLSKIDEMLNDKENLESEFRMKLLMFAIRHDIEDMTVNGNLIVHKHKPNPKDEVGDRMYEFKLNIDILDYRTPDDKNLFE